MPSPFPGMDPFLEDPAFFSDLHDSLIIYLREYLNERLPEPYVAASAARVWIEPERRTVGPDVTVLPPPSAEPGVLPPSGGAGVALAEAVVTQPVVVHVPRVEVRETFLEIYARPAGERLVTTVEVLSPSNKTPGAQGRDQHLRKQQEVLLSQVHLVEIDLLRAGTHTTAVPFAEARASCGVFDYHVCVRSFDRPEDFLVYPVRLADRLPTVAVPLLPGDPPVAVDLQAVFTRCYDSGRLERRVRYADLHPVPPLSAEQARWAEKRLRSEGRLNPATAS